MLSDKGALRAVTFCFPFEPSQTAARYGADPGACYLVEMPVFSSSKCTGFEARPAP